MIRLDGTSVGGSGGGGGTPGGSTTQVQYNNAGSFGGMTVTRDATSGGLQFQGQPIVFGFEGTSYWGPSAPVVAVTGTDYPGIMVGQFTDGSHYHAMGLFSTADSYEIVTLVNGSIAGTALALNSESLYLHGGTSELSIGPEGGLTFAAGFLFNASLQIANGKSIQTEQTGSAFMIRAWDTDDGAWRTFVTVTGANSPSLVISPPAVGTTVDIYATTLAAAGDGGGVATTTMITNAVNSTVTNAYIVKGGQAATTANTGWTKIYIGTNAAWVPYWQNATP